MLCTEVEYMHTPYCQLIWFQFVQIFDLFLSENVMFSRIGLFSAIFFDLFGMTIVKI